MNLAYTIIVFNDNDYGLISWKQERSIGKSVYTKLGNPDFKKLAESFGIKGYKIEKTDNIEQQLSTIIQKKELALVEIPINPKVNNELIKKLEAYFS